MLNTTQTRVDARTPAERTGPLGRGVRLLLAVGFAYGFATVVDVRAGAVCPVVLTDGFVNAFWAQKLPAGALVFESSRVSRT